MCEAKDFDHTIVCDAVDDQMAWCTDLHSGRDAWPDQSGWEKEDAGQPWNRTPPGRCRVAAHRFEGKLQQESITLSGSTPYEDVVNLGGGCSGKAIGHSGLSTQS